MIQRARFQREAFRSAIRRPNCRMAAAMMADNQVTPWVVCP